MSWKGDKYRHSLASRGIRTSIPIKKISDDFEKHEYLIEIPNYFCGKKLSKKQKDQLKYSLLEISKMWASCDEYGEDNVDNMISENFEICPTLEHYKYYLNYKMDEIKQIHKNLSKKKEVKLYRYLFLDNVNEFDKTNIGNHFILDKDDIEYSELAITNDEYISRTYLLEISTSPKNINWIETLINNVGYPHEKEIELFSNIKYNYISLNKVLPERGVKL